MAFEQLGVEVPARWSVNATNILAQKYFRGTLGTPEREASLRQVVDRVADTITAWGVKDGYFVDDAEAEAFRAELIHLVITQKAAFNSPVWFNIGVKGVPAQASACQPYYAPVSTPEGLVPIGQLVEENAVGTKVFDAHGVTKVLALKANGRKPVLRIRTPAGHQLDVTPDHLVWRCSGDEGGEFVEAGTLRLGDRLEWHDTESFGWVTQLEIETIEELGETDVYDIQTESGEYLSGNLRVHNCFILAVEDQMDSILNWYVEEGTIFKGGSGSGINLSRIRSSKEGLAGGGTASGPVSFMRGADASAGTIKSGGKCFREGTLVGTPNGLKPIEQLRMGDLVLTHEGPRAIADFMPNGEKQCYLVRTEEGYEVEVTAGHKFAYWDHGDGGFAVKPIEEFRPGDALYALLAPSTGGVKVPLLPPQLADPVHATTTVEMTFPTELDDRLAYVVGVSYGDGELRTTYPYRLRVAFCKDQAGQVSAARFAEYCEQLFGERPLVLEDRQRHVQIGLTRKRLVDFLAVNGLAKGKGHALGFPSTLYTAEPSVRAAFIAGVIDADGSYQQRGGWAITSIDRTFLICLQRLLLTLGVPSKVKLSRAPRGSWKAVYRLHIVGYTFVDRLVEWIKPYSAKAQVNYVSSPGADKGW
ncbi:MAG TPA: LAGLIDADG family homing endonuclease, partial [Acidimicrobiales bacterium]|nr:LAGLIDADG family homing endonuclease [Acidimicrobiales bacterium]